MAEELQPPENGGAIATAPAAAATLAAAPLSEQQPMVSKRQRRPSVRLGDIGGDHISYDHHHLHHQQTHHHRRGKPQWKDSSSNKASKTRHLTNLSSNETLTLTANNSSSHNNNVISARNFNSNTNNNENDNLHEDDDEDNYKDGNLDSVAVGSWKVRDFKTKRAATTKRVRTNWVLKSNDVVEGDDKILSGNIEDLDNDNQAISREFEPENSDPSPIHSYGNVNNDNLGIEVDRGHLVGSNRRRRVTRVSEEGPSDTEARNWRSSTERSGVKVWLEQLGLLRYAPLFEIHEVDDEVLPMLTLEDLKDMGINAVGSRRKMYCSIQKMNKRFC